jgi:phosphoglycerate dehydrogenase-like enzyme
MPPHAIVIHTARGGVVDEEALIARLRDGGIAGAGVDVFADEPPDRHCGYLPLPNVVLSPHTARTRCRRWNAWHPGPRRRSWRSCRAGCQTWW